MADRWTQPPQAVSPETEHPPLLPFEAFRDARAAVERLQLIFDRNTAFLRERFAGLAGGSVPQAPVRACYPEVRIATSSHARLDQRLSYGFVPGPGRHAITVTRPDLFASYLEEQIDLLIRNHDVPVEVGESETPIPLHFAFVDGTNVDGVHALDLDRPLADFFDVPDLAVMDDAIANGTYEVPPGGVHPLAPFTAPRVDYSLARLQHYTATAPEHFQNYVLFTNYQFYVDEFCKTARALLADESHGYDSFVEPGNLVTMRGESKPSSGTALARLPQMPAYHLTSARGRGITMVNIGVGPSNAKTITDHIAVLRPHAWLMLGHCAGLRNTQKLGDYVLAHGYVREDHVLDDDLPTWVPIPPLAEVQVAVEEAVAEVTGLEGYELKRVDAHGNGRLHRQPQLGAPRLPRARASFLPVARHRARHGIGHHRRQRFPLPRALRHAPVRLRQAAARRVEAAGHGNGILPAPDLPAPGDRHPHHGEAARHAQGAPAFPQAAQLRGNGLSVERPGEGPTGGPARTAAGGAVGGGRLALLPSHAALLARGCRQLLEPRGPRAGRAQYHKYLYE